MSSPRSDAKAPRDPRLDVFRGVGMLIILVAHIPGNAWADWIPAALRLLRRDRDLRLLLGRCLRARLRPRVRARRLAAWHGAHSPSRLAGLLGPLGVFIAVVALLAAADLELGGRYLRHGLNLGPFLDDPARMLLGYATLTYVPNYFDILPMYLVILALIPLVMAAARLGRGAVGGLVGLLYLLAYARLLDLPAEPWSERVWFFNPFSWQLLVLPRLRLRARLARAAGLRPAAHARRACGRCAAALPFSCQYGWSCFAAWGAVPWLGEMHQALASAASTRRISRRCASCISWRSPISPIRLPARAGGGCRGAFPGGAARRAPDARRVPRRARPGAGARRRARRRRPDAASRRRSRTSEAAACRLASPRSANGSSPRPGCTPEGARAGGRARPAACPERCRPPAVS